MDGKVTISTELDNSGIPKGLKDITGKFGGLKGALGQTEKAIEQAFSKPIALAQAKVTELERQYERVTAQFNEAKMTDNDAMAQRFGTKQEQIYERLAAARNRLAIEEQAAAQKQASSEEQVAGRIRTAFTSAFSGMKRLATGFRNVFTKAFSGVHSVLSGFSKLLAGIRQRFSGLNKSVAGFGSRLKSVVLGAFVFNVISAALRKVTEYFRTAIMSSSQMQTAMANLRGAAISAAGPIIQILTPALAALANMAATVLSYIAQLISFFTGKAISAAATATKQMNGAAGAAKKASRSLAGFDEITKLDDNSDGGGGGGAGADTPTVNMSEVELPDWAKLVAEKLKEGEWSAAATLLTDKINSVMNSVDWAGVGQKLAYGIDGALEFLATAILTFDWYGLGSNLATALNEIINNVDWENLGVVIGAKFIALIGTLGGLFATLDWSGLGHAVASSFMGLWNAIDWTQAAIMISDGLIGILDSISTAIKNVDWQKIGNDIALLLASIDWSGIMTSLSDGIGAALGGLAALLWGLIEDAWNSVVDWWYDVAYDDGGFTIEGLLKGIGDVLKNIGKWINDNIFKPFIEGFESAFKINSPSKVMEDEGGFVIAGLFNGITEAWAKITQFFNDAVSWFRTTFDNIAKIASDSWSSIQQTWSVVSGWFSQNIIDPVTQAFTNLWSNLQLWANEAWAGITGVFGSVGDWFGETFGDAWERVKKVFSSGGQVFDGIKEGIVSSFTSIVNRLISGINRVVAVPFDGLNSAIRRIRNVSVLGMYPFSGLSTVSVPSLPYLAKGAVLPANKPFMAVVGDQRHGTNVEAPLTTIQEAVAEVMADQAAGMMRGFEALLEENRMLREVVENIYVGDDVIGSAAQRYNHRMAIMHGG